MAVLAALQETVPVSCFCDEEESCDSFEDIFLQECLPGFVCDLVVIEQEMNDHCHC